ncbi:CpaA protein [Pseudomonas savastanoi pv. glycinea]|nr:CpaA protein [Pseudomonas savastanoi pv. glycinea]
MCRKGLEKVMGALLKQEKFLLLAIIAMFVAYPLEHVLLGNGQVVALVSGLALVGFIVCASMRVAHHRVRITPRCSRKRSVTPTGR